MKKVLIFSLLVSFLACNTYKDLPKAGKKMRYKTMRIAPSPQQMDGDPEAGLDYLVSGDYIGSGLPFAMLEKRFGKGKKDTIFNRTGLNENVAYAATVFEAENGTIVSNGNCFTCHASYFQGKINVGLGNSFSDYTKSLVKLSKLMNLGVRIKYKKDSKEFEAFEDFGNYFKAMAPHIKTNQPGANPAFRLAEACMNHRNPVDLRFQKTANYEINDYPIATDVPPLWNVKKKNALYYNAIGRGDFTKLLFQASVLGIPDSAQARKAVTNFKDVLAWLNQLEAPEYPGQIDTQLAEKGQLLFETHCSDCHGTYGEDESYPNKVVSVDHVKTDPLYAYYAMNSGIVDWYNNSWFANSSPKSYFEPLAGYIAPPLDGIWATAPYLHNGSVPTLEDLLNSAQRPVYWSRTGKSKDYDFEKVGWNYTVAQDAKGDWTFDTTLPGYSKEGHDFGDQFKSDERKAVIEYLKML